MSKRKLRRAKAELFAANRRNHKRDMNADGTLKTAHGAKAETKSESAKDVAMAAKDVDVAIRLSNAPRTFKPGSTVAMPESIRIRSWKAVNTVPNAKLRKFNPKRAPWPESMWKKKRDSDMKAIESQLA